MVDELSQTSVEEHFTITASAAKHRSMNYSVEHVVAEYHDCLETAKIYSARVKEAENEKIQLVTQIESKLEQIRLALFPVEGRRKVFLAWRLIHRVGEDLILLMTFDELLALGRKVLHDLKTSNLSDIVRLDWLPKVEESVKRLETLCDKSEEEIKKAEVQIRCASQLFCTVTNIINDYVDDRFWDIWARKYMTFIYSLLLAANMLALLGFFKFCGVHLSYVSIAFIGVIGGLASGILTSEQEFFAKGHFWVTTVSYPLQRMLQGWLAALLMFAMIQAGFLVRILPPIDEQQQAPYTFVPFANATSLTKVKQATPALSPQKGKQRPSPETTSTKSAPRVPVQSAMTSAISREGTKALLDLRAPDDKQFYLYFVMLLIAGFVGDKLLKAISDKVTSRLFAEAEKTKEAR